MSILSFLFPQNISTPSQLWKKGLRLAKKKKQEKQTKDNNVPYLSFNCKQFGAVYISHFSSRVVINGIIFS